MTRSCIALALFTLVVLSASAPVCSVRAQDVDDAGAQLGGAPYGNEVRKHYYQALAKCPYKAFGWELLAPGAGSVYNGLYPNAIVTAAISVAGAGLWVAGAVTDRDALWWAGAGTFTAGRVYGLVSAPVGSMLLNAAFRRQLGISGRF